MSPASHRRVKSRPLAYARLAAALCVLDLVVIGLVAGDVHGPVRFVLGLCFALSVPGWAMVGLLRIGAPLVEASLCVASGLGLLLVLSQLAVSLEWWHLSGLEVLVGACALPSLVFQALERPVARQVRS